MITWNDWVDESVLSYLTAGLLAVTSYVIQLVNNPLYPPNHNDFLGLANQTSLLWAPWVQLERLLSHFFIAPVYYEMISFIAVSVTLLCLFFTVQRVTNRFGGLAACILFALSPFAVRGASVVPLPSLIGLFLTSFVVLMGYGRDKVSAGLLVVASVAVGFFPLYAVGLLFAILSASLFEWLKYPPSTSFRTGLAGFSLLPTFILTLFYDWQGILALYGESFSVISQTLPQGFSIPTLLTWFGPLTVVFAVVAAYRSIGGVANNAPIFVGLAVIGAVLFAQRFVDPLLGFSLLGLGLFGLCGVGAHDVINIQVRERYRLVLYGTIFALILVALINLVAFLQVDVEASRPTSGDVRGYSALEDYGVERVMVSPRESVLAKYYLGSDAVPGSWQLRFANDSNVYERVFITDLVEEVPENTTLVVSNWVQNRTQSDIVDRLESSECFQNVIAIRGFSAWDSECVVEVSVAESPSAED